MLVFEWAPISLSKKSRHDSDQSSWPKEQTQNPTELQHALAWIESSGTLSVAEQLHRYDRDAGNLSNRLGDRAVGFVDRPCE